MKSINLIRTPSSKDKPLTQAIGARIIGPQSTGAEHTIPKARYGEKASLITLIKDCLTSLLRKPPRITALILALALTIPAAIAIVSTGISSAEKNLLDSRHVTVFLANNSNASATQLAEALGNNKHIISTVVRPVDLQNAEVLTIDIQPAATLDKAKLDFIVTELNSHTLVDYVAADKMWLARNVEAIETARILRVICVATAALITAIFVYLLTRSDLPQQNSELTVLRQLGASRKTMLRPLLLRCILVTLVAAVVGTLLAWEVIESLPHLVDMSTYTQILPQSFPATRMISLIVFALFSSFLTVRILAKKP